jgi:hypothetical protein
MLDANTASSAVVNGFVSKISFSLTRILGTLIKDDLSTDLNYIMQR